MTNQRRRDAKEKKRAARIRLRKARRLEAQQCDRLLFEAEVEWRAKRPDRAERLLEKVVQINPHHREAHLHLAELCFVTRRLEEGLRHFERVPVDEVPTPLVFYAADAVSRPASSIEARRWRESSFGGSGEDGRRRRIARLERSSSISAATEDGPPSAPCARRRAGRQTCTGGTTAQAKPQPMQPSAPRQTMRTGRHSSMP